MGGWKRHPFQRYTAALLAVAGAFVVLTIPAIRHGIGTPILVLFFAILLAAWYGGLGPGLVALGLVAIITATPLDSPERVARYALFLAGGAIICWLLESLHGARRRVEEGAADLRRSEARFRQLIESMTDHAIFTTDSDQRVTSWSPGAERLLGYHESEVIGRMPAFFVVPDEISGNGLPATPGTAMLPHGAGPFKGDRRCVRKDGTPFCTSTSVTALLRDGTPGNTWVLR